MYVSVCVYVGTDRPALKYLYAHVIGNIANDWYDIGVALLDPGDEVVLDTINKNHPGDAEECAAEMLKLWLCRKPEASWDLLLEALKELNIKLNTLAVKIEKMLTKGKYSSSYMLAAYKYFTKHQRVNHIERIVSYCHVNNSS